MPKTCHDMEDSGAWFCDDTEPGFRHTEDWYLRRIPNNVELILTGKNHLNKLHPFREYTAGGTETTFDSIARNGEFGKTEITSVWRPKSLDGLGKRNACD